MSRVSDTRLRTREAAAHLVSIGRRPHDLTVDLIYAEIKQGSRTTINDELKLWKDEQAKADALTAALPPVVASAMLNMWALAVEHGEKVFDQRLEEVETQLAKATTNVESLVADKNGLLQQNETLQADIAQGQSELAAVRELLTAERVAKGNAISRVNALEQQLESVKTDAAQSISIVKSEHRLHVQELQAAHAAQESSFRQEIDKATERLEGVQKHVMLQVTEAREAQKRAETLLSKTNQKNEQLSAEVQQLGRQIASIAQTSERAQADLTQAQGVIDKIRSERESLVQQVATAAGKLGVLEQQVESLERRAVGAETRLETVLKRPAAEKRKTGKHHGDFLIGE
jgi:chromosome segregation ATPase